MTEDVGTRRVGFVGLGAMGAPMAEQLAASHHDVTVFDTDVAAVDRVHAAGAAVADDLPSLARAVDVVILMLPHPEVVRQVVLGEDGLVAGLGSATTVIDMSTSGPEVVRECGAALAERGVAMMDAPVGKGPWAAEKGELTILMGGDRDVCRRAEPVLRYVGSDLHYCGPLGSGQVLKLANNLVACGNMAILAEAYSLTVAEGADADILMSLMPGTSADSWQLRHTLLGKILAGDSSPMFRLGLAAKDMRLVTELGERANTRMECGKAAQTLYDQAEAAGHGDHDWGAVVLVDNPEVASDS